MMDVLAWAVIVIVVLSIVGVLGAMLWQSGEWAAIGGFLAVLAVAAALTTALLWALDRVGAVE